MVIETRLLGFVINFLQGVEEYFLCLRELALSAVLLGSFDVFYLKRRHHKHRICQGCEQRNEYNPWKGEKDIPELSLYYQKHREEHQGNGKRGHQHRAEQFPGAEHCRFHTTVSRSNFVHIPVYGYDGIVHYHSQNHNQCRQGDRIQRNAGNEHDCDSHRSADRYAG